MTVTLEEVKELRTNVEQAIQEVHNLVEVCDWEGSPAFDGLKDVTRLVEQFADEVELRQVAVEVEASRLKREALLELAGADMSVLGLGSGPDNTRLFSVRRWRGKVVEFADRRYPEG